MPESNASSLIKRLWTRPTLLCRSSQNSDGHHLVVQLVLGFRVQTHTSSFALFTLYRSGTWISQLKLNSLCLQNETLLAAEHNIYMMCDPGVCFMQTMFVIEKTHSISHWNLPGIIICACIHGANNEQIQTTNSQLSCDRMLTPWHCCNLHLVIQENILE